MVNFEIFTQSKFKNFFVVEHKLRFLQKQTNGKRQETHIYRFYVLSSTIIDNKLVRSLYS